MQEKIQFDMLNSPLEGKNLIEASAGTGKTYTITGLFLRLMLEKRLSVNEILVVTFTEAATEELKERIRNRLRDAINAFTFRKSEDPLLNYLLNRHKDSNRALTRLREALMAFDQSAIFTMHGFCRRMLQENAFESGNLFDTELITDQEYLKQEIVEDFWRRNFYEASPVFVNYAIFKKISPGYLFKLLANRAGQPYMKIIPSLEMPETYQQEQDFKESFHNVKEMWLSVRSEIEEILLSYKGLNRAKYRKKSIAGWIHGMDNFIISGSDNPVLFKEFAKFTASEIRASIKKNHEAPAHRFFDICERLRISQARLEEVFEQRLIWLKGDLFNYAEGELFRRKDRENIQSFDDLLIKMDMALEGEGRELLSKAIRRKFKAALIDEFQDTDPIQYSIFKTIFSTEKGILFLIGDPKQAIYSFRGADIFTYMSATGDVGLIYTLGENWRSEPGLINGINSIFSYVEQPFLYDEIGFQPAVPAPGKAQCLKINGKSEAPFQFWFSGSEEFSGQGKGISKENARKIISDAVAAEISRLLHLARKGRAVIGDKPLREGDIAVLVRTNSEARQMQLALLALHIPSVLFNAGDLFETHEATEMGRVLTGIAQADSVACIKAALATDILGVCGEKLEALMENDAAWERRVIRFKKYFDLWNGRGFIRMFRQMIIDENVLARLMTLPDGERRNTNLLHLSEVLHQISVEKKMGVMELIKWFFERRKRDAKGVEEHPLRLESDENSVRLVTMHKSKGLEYPVVFCPFTWGGSRIKKREEPFTFHDQSRNSELILDLGSSDMAKNRGFAEKELLAENLRLMYVALTRARNRCYFIWGRFNDAGTSAPAYLFHQPATNKGDDLISATEERFKGLKDNDLLQELKIIIDRSEGSIRLTKVPSMVDAEPFSPFSREQEALECRKFFGKIRRRWSVSSFSSFISGISDQADMPEHDGLIRYDRVVQKGYQESGLIHEQDIFAFPAGARAGIFMHDLFEHLDFGQRDVDSISELIRSKLKEYGFASGWRDTLYSMIINVLSMPLGSEGEKFTLSLIKNHERLNELEFYFPLKKISPEKLEGIFKGKLEEPVEEFSETIGRLQFSPVKGFMRGFIDMVFQWHDRYYLIDWKSNFLGTRISDYNRDALNVVMKEKFYILQYHIYTVALDQYLRVRLPGYKYKKHFGGVYYIFLRGINPEMDSEAGIFMDHPSPALISSLREGLLKAG